MCASFPHAVSFPLKAKSESASCLVVSDSFYAMDYTVHGILQARILEWVAFPFSRGSSQPRDPSRSPALQADSLPAEPQGKPTCEYDFMQFYHVLYHVTAQQSNYRTVIIIHLVFLFIVFAFLLGTSAFQECLPLPHGA